MIESSDWQLGMQEEFVRDGIVSVEGALDPDFCEAVVADAFRRMGVVEDDRTTWPSGRTNLPVVRNWPLAEISPVASAVVDEIVGADWVAFAGVQDNLIVNLPDPAQQWWAPTNADAATRGWHKDGDWFRHFLDSPEQGLLVIVFWRDVTEDQGATYVAMDSIGPIAELLAAHPEGLEPSQLGPHVVDIVGRCRQLRALTGRQGTIAFAHPFLAHTASVNGTDRPRVISNSSVMLKEPMRFDRDPGSQSALERSILRHLRVEALQFEATGDRKRITSARAESWKEQREQASPSI